MVSTVLGGIWGTTELFCVTLNPYFIRKQEAFKWTCSSSAGDPRLHFDFISFLRELLRLGQQRKDENDFLFQVQRLGETTECIKIGHLLWSTRD